MQGISFSAHLLNYVDEIRENGWGRIRAWRRIRQDYPYTTEAEVRRLLTWMQRNPIKALDDHPVEEVVEKQHEAHKADLYQRYEAKKQRALVRDADKWHRFETSVLELLQQLPPGPTYPKRASRRRPDPYALVLSATDFHWGMYSWEGESYQPYDMEEARSRLLRHTERILGRVPARPEVIYLGIGSDFFHVDGDRLMTSRGTPMDAQGTPLEIFKSGLDLNIEHIERLAEVAPVVVFQMAGNHDKSNGFAALLVLHAWFRNHPNVTVEMDFHPRVYLEYGCTMMAFSHGDGAPISRLASAMATEAREMWGRARHHIAFGGHLHHQVVKEDQGIVYCQLRSLAGADRYHSRHGWVSAHAGLDAYIIEKHDGPVGAVWSAE